MADDIDRVEALETLIRNTILTLGDEKTKPFEIEAYFECVVMDDYHADELCPRVKITKR